MQAQPTVRYKRVSYLSAAVFEVCARLSNLSPAQFSTQGAISCDLHSCGQTGGLTDGLTEEQTDGRTEKRCSLHAGVFEWQSLCQSVVFYEFLWDADRNCVSVLSIGVYMCLLVSTCVTCVLHDVHNLLATLCVFVCPSKHTCPIFYRWPSSLTFGDSDQNVKTEKCFQPVRLFLACIDNHDLFVCTLLTD